MNKAMAKKTEAQLRKIMRDTRAQLDDIEEKRLIKKRLPMVGKCFKFLNSYGSDKKWWLYIKVLRLDGVHFIYFMFEKTSSGMIKIVPEEFGYLGEEYEEIPCYIFDAEWQELLEEISGLDS